MAINVELESTASTDSHIITVSETISDGIIRILQTNNYYSGSISFKSIKELEDLVNLTKKLYADYESAKKRYAEIGGE